MDSLPEKEAKELIEAAIELLAILKEVPDHEKDVDQPYVERRLHLAINEAEFASA